MVNHLLSQNRLNDEHLKFLWICLTLQHRNWYSCMQLEEQEKLLLHIKSLKSWPGKMQFLLHVSNRGGCFVLRFIQLMYGIFAIAGCYGILAVTGRNGVLAVTGRNGALAVAGHNGVLAITGFDGILAITVHNGILAIMAYCP